MTPTVGPAPSSLPPHYDHLLRSRLFIPEFVCSSFLPSSHSPSSPISVLSFLLIPLCMLVALVYVFICPVSICLCQCGILHASLCLFAFSLSSLFLVCRRPTHETTVSLSRLSFCHSNSVFLWLDLPLIILLCVSPVNLCPLAKLILSIITIFILCSLYLF